MGKGKSQICIACELDRTTEPDGICNICKAQIVSTLRDEIEAMLQYDEHLYKSVEIVNNTIVVRVFDGDL